MTNLGLVQRLERFSVNDDAWLEDVDKQLVWIEQDWRDVFDFSESDVQNQLLILDVTQREICHRFVIHVIFLFGPFNYQLDELTNVCSVNIFVFFLQVALIGGIVLLIAFKKD